MSFIDQYLDKNRLSALSDAVKTNLNKLEDQLKAQTVNPADFDDQIKVYGPQIADLVERVSAEISTLSVKSWSDAWSLLRFVKTIGFEVYQIVRDMENNVVPADLTGQARRDRIVAFGTDLTYFVWLTIDPLGGRFTWLPFKATIEQKLVRWLAGMAINFSIDFFSKQMSTSSVGLLGVQARPKLGSPHLKAI